MHHDECSKYMDESTEDYLLGLYNMVIYKYYPDILTGTDRR
jgi:hypothetical protein